MKQRIKQITSWLLSFCIVISMFTGVDFGFIKWDGLALKASAGIITVSPLTSSTRSLSGGIHTVSGNVAINGDSANPNGLTVSGTTVIYIAPGASLTVKGADASGTTGGGAGIYVPSNAALIITGGGTLSATGGKGANGSDGGDGFNGNAALYPSTGGRGGAGGGGAGAGIGTAGGKGGDERAGDRNYGLDGIDGTAANTAGTVYKLGNVSINPTGGLAGSSGGTGGAAGNWASGKDAGGGGGGGGGRGGAGENVGTGGQGGGSGGAGGGAQSGVGWGGGGGGGAGTSGTGGAGGTGHSNDAQYAGRNGADASGISGGNGGAIKDSTGRKGGNGGSGGANGTSKSYSTGTPADAQYSITLDRNNGTGGSASTTATYGVKPDNISVPTRTGYDFKGYYTASTNGTQVYSSSGTVNSSVTSYTDSNGGWINASNSITLYAQWEPSTSAVTLNNTGKAYYGTSTEITSPSTSAPANGSTTFTYYSQIPATVTVPTRSGYTFQGYWSTNAVTGGTQYYNANGTRAYTPTWATAGAVTIYARWKANEYTVTLDTQGVTNAAVKPESQQATGGTGSVTATFDVAMPTMTRPNRNGYTFAGYRDSNGSYLGGTEYYNDYGNSARTWNKSNAATLYAHWTANSNYNITFDKNGGTNGSNNAMATFDSNMPNITIPEREHYTFGGYWTVKNDDSQSTAGSGVKYYTGDSGNGATTSATPWNIYTATTLYAKWITPYDVTYDANGGNYNGITPNGWYDINLKRHNYTLNLTSLIPTWPGYAFRGWATSPTATAAQYAPGAAYATNADLDLYAVWTTLPAITISKSTLNESAANDGGVTDTQLVALTNGKFAANMSSYVTVNYLPQGLTASVTRLDDTTLQISFTGKAAHHVSADTVKNASITIKSGGIIYPTYGSNNATASQLNTANFSFVFRDAATPAVPSITDPYADNITSASARMNSTVNITVGENMIASSVKERGFVYIDSLNGQNPVIGGTNVTKMSSGNGTGAFSVNPAGLDAGHKYYFAAYAITEYGTYYSNIKMFTASATPTLGGTTILSVKTDTASVNGSVLDDGGSSITETGVVYSTSANPVIGGTGVTKRESTSKVVGAFTVDLSSLTPDTLYYVRTYAINDSGTAYSTQTTMRTAATAAVTVNTYLQSLTVDGGTMIPGFNKDVQTYTVSIPSGKDSVGITPTVADGNATLRVYVDSGISLGGDTTTSGAEITVTGIDNGKTNPVYVEVTNGGQTRTYIVNLISQSPNNADLTNITLYEVSKDGILIPLSVAFDKDTSNYTAIVDASVITTYVELEANEGVTATINGQTAIASADGRLFRVVLLNTGGTVGLNGASTTITVKATSKDAKTTKTYTVLVIRTASSNAELADLKAGSVFGGSNYTLYPEPDEGVFNPAQTGYSMTAPSSVSDIWITPTAAEDDATVLVNWIDASGAGHILSNQASYNITGLATGGNPVYITVTSPDGSTTAVYTVVVTKAASADTGLTGLTVVNASGGANQPLIPNFSATTTAYTVTVANSVTSVKITPTVSAGSYRFSGSPTYSAATSFSQDAAYTMPLQNGANVIYVHAVNGATTKTTALTVIRAVSSNANLESIESDDIELNPEFARALSVFGASVTSDVDSIALTATPEDTNATITLSVNGGTSATVSGEKIVTLNTGINTLIYTATAQDGVTVKQYTVNITRPSSSNARLDSLAITKTSGGDIYDIGFDADTSTYYQSVPIDVTGVTITAEAADSGATVYINGTETDNKAITLSPGSNEVVVRVVAADGITVKQYTVVIFRLESDDCDLTALSITADGLVDALSPAFNAGTYSYTASVEPRTDKATITATAVKGARVNIIKGGTTLKTALPNGENPVTATVDVTLVTGDNAFTIETVAPSGATKVYTLTITRKDTYTGLTATESDAINFREKLQVPKNETLDISTITLSASDTGKVTYSLGALTNDNGVLSGTPTLIGNTLYYTGAAGIEKDKTASQIINIHTENYVDITTTITFNTVDKTPVTISGYSDNQDHTYNSASFMPSGTLSITITDGGTNVTSELTGKVVYTYTGKNGTDYGPNTFAPRDVGEYSLTISINEDNEDYTGNTTVDFIISKATPSINWPSGLQATVGETLADVALPADNGTGTPGTFAWTAATTTSVGSDGEQPHNVTFTPHDSRNYEDNTQDVTITVSDGTVQPPANELVATPDEVTIYIVAGDNIEDEYDLEQIILTYGGEPVDAEDYEIGTLTDNDKIFGDGEPSGDFEGASLLFEIPVAETETDDGEAVDETAETSDETDSETIEETDTTDNEAVDEADTENADETDSTDVAEDEIDGEAADKTSGEDLDMLDGANLLAYVATPGTTRSIEGYAAEEDDNDGVQPSIDGTTLKYTPTGLQSAGQEATQVVTITADGETVDVTFTFVVVENPTETVTISASSDNGTYDGNPHDGYTGLSIMGSADLTAELSDELTIIYSGRNGTSHSDSSTPPINAGDYTVTIELDGTVNDGGTDYIGGNTVEIDFSISKATAPSVTDPDEINIPEMLTATRSDTLELGGLLGIPTDAGTTTFILDMFSNSGSVLTGMPTLSGSTLSYEAAAGVGSGKTSTQQVTIKMKNYKDASVTVMFETVPKKSVTVTLAGVNSEYTGTAHDGNSSLTIMDGGSDVTATLLSDLEKTYIGIGSTTYGPTSTAPTNAGTYKLTVELINDEYSGKDTADFSITKATPTITPATSLTAELGKTLGDVSLDGFTSGGVAGTFSWTAGNTTKLEILDDNTFNVTFTPTDNKNYNTATANVTVNVTQISSGLTATPDAVTTTFKEGETAIKTFNLKDAIQLSLGTDKTGAVKYALDGSVSGANPGIVGGVSIDENSGVLSYTPSGSQIKNQTATQSVKIKTENYMDIPVTVTFKVADKIDPVVTWPSFFTASFGETLADLELPENRYGTSGEFTWTLGDSTSVGVVGEKDFNVTFTPTAIGDYNVVNQDVLVTVYAAETLNLTSDTLTVNMRQALTAQTTYKLYDRIESLFPAGADKSGLNCTPAMFTDNQNIMAGTPTVTGTTLFYTPTANKAVGDTATQTITVYTDNYAPATVTVTYLVVDKGEVEIDATSNTSSKDYNDNPFAPNVSSLSVIDDEGDSVSLTIGNELEYVYYGVSGTSYGPSTTAPKDVGSYTFTIRVKTGNADYRGESAPFAFTINKVDPPTVNWPTNIPAVYGQTLGEITLTNNGTGTDGSFSWKNPADDVGTVAGPNTHDVTFTPTDTRNYNSKDGAATIAVSKAPGLTASPDNTVIFIATDANTPDTCDLSGTTFAAPFDATVSVTYSDGILTDDDSIISSASVSYGGTLTYTPSGSGSEGDSATQYIKVTTDNYQDITISVTFYVTDKEIVTISGVTVTQDKVYNDGRIIAPYIDDITIKNTQDQDVDASVRTELIGTIQYLYQGITRNDDTYSDENPPTEAGNYTLTITVENDDYIGVKIISFTIAQAEPVIDWPADLEAVYRDTLADVILPDVSADNNGTTDVKGVWSWTYGDTTSVGRVGSREHSLTFTPDDKNYKAVSGTVTITVAPPPTGGKLENPITQDMVDDVFGGLADLDTSTIPPTITLTDDLILLNSIEIGTDVIIDMNGFNIYGPEDKPAIIITENNVDVTFKNNKTDPSDHSVIKGGNGSDGSPNGQPGQPAIMVSDGCTGGTITIGINVTAEGGKGGNGTSGKGGDGGNGVSGGDNDVIINGGAEGGDGGDSDSGTGGNGGDGANTDSGDITVGDGGSAEGGDGGDSNTGTGGNGGAGTSTDSGETNNNGSVSGGDGGDSNTGDGGAGGNGSESDTGEINNNGEATGGGGGDSHGNGDGGAGGNGLDSGSGDITIGDGGSADGGEGGDSSGSGSGGNGGDGASTGGSGNITIDDGGSADGGDGGDSNSGTGGNGGNGTSAEDGETTNNGETNGGNGGDSNTGDGGNGGNGIDSGDGDVNNNGDSNGGSGGNSNTGDGGNGGNGIDTEGGDVTIGDGGSSEGGEGGNSSGSGSGGTGGDGVNTDSGDISVEDGGSSDGGNGGGSNSGPGGDGGAGTSTDSGETNNEGSISGGDGGDSVTGDGGDGGNGIESEDGNVNNDGDANGGNGGNSSGNGNGGNGGNGIDTEDGDVIIGGGGSSEGGDGGSSSGSGNGGTGGDGVNTDSGDITVETGGSSDGGDGGGSSSGSGGDGGAGTSTDSGTTTIESGGDTNGGDGGDSNSGPGGDGGNGSESNSGDIINDGAAQGGDGGDSPTAPGSGGEGTKTESGNISGGGTSESGENGQNTTPPVANVTISFNANGGSGSKASITVAKGSSYTLPANPFTRNNYTFAGWKINNGGTTLAVGTSIVVNGNTALYAQWSYSGGGSGGGGGGGSDGGGGGNDGGSGGGNDGGNGNGNGSGNAGGNDVSGDRDESSTDSSSPGNGTSDTTPPRTPTNPGVNSDASGSASASGQPADSLSSGAESSEAADSSTTESITSVIPSESIKETTVYDLGEGTITLTIVKSDGQDSIVAVVNTKAFIEAILSPEELARVAAGEHAEIQINIQHLVEELEEVPADDKASIEDSINKFATQIEGLKLGKYIDITMQYRIGNGEWIPITEASEEIHLTINIPADLLEDGATYFIMRCHGGYTVLLHDLDTDPETITIASKLFSTYAIVYTMQEVTPEALEAVDRINAESADSAQKSVGSRILIGLLTLSGVGAAIYFLLYKRRKKDEEKAQ